MSGYRLSPIRSKGWMRIGLLGAVLMAPYTIMIHAQGRFSEGPNGIQQAAEFLAGGAAMWVVIGLGMSWVLHGFAVKSHDDGDSESTIRHNPAPHTPAPHTSAPASHTSTPPHQTPGAKGH